MATRLLPLLALVWLLTTGCGAHYTTPGRGADLRAMTGDMAREMAAVPQPGDPSIVSALGTQPLARFPTGVAVVRIQAPGYESETADGWGTGRYSFITTRDI